MRESNLYKLATLKITVTFVLSLLINSEVNAETQILDNRSWRLTEEQWDLVKQGEQLLKMPVLQDLIDTLSLQTGQVIELRYPGGEEGELWVEELKDWLISLAIPSKYLLAVAGSGEADVIIIKIVKVGDV
ncbi:MAG: hypothetical protein OEM07_03125 [Gammaproteobacteria bacterium]|nr:hypothetical protein [Gammaproteobacteria bacterium]